MSFHVCHCGWSKATSYQGLRIHQGKMGCTPKGLRIPQEDYYGYSIPKFSTPIPQIKIKEPLPEVTTRLDTQDFTTRKLLSGQTGTSKSQSLQRDSGQITGFSQYEVPKPSEMSLQVCHCGWSKVTTYQGLRTHQGMKGCTTKGVTIPQDHHSLYNIPSFSAPIPRIKIKEPRPEVGIRVDSTDLTTPRLFSAQTGTSKNPCQKRDIGHSGGLPPNIETLFPVTLSTVTTPAAAADTVANPSCFGTPLGSFRRSTNLDQARPVVDFSSGAQQQGLFSSGQNVVTKPPPFAFAEPEPNPSYFGTPQGSGQSPASSGKVRRALDFYTGAQQGERLIAAEEKAATEREREKAKQEQIRADLARKTREREKELAEVKKAAETCKGGLDAELREINCVFDKVRRVVEDAWQKAVQPLTERRNAVEREAKVAVDALQREIDDLKRTLGDFERTPDVQAPPLRQANETRDWSGGAFGTFRTSISLMMRQIEQELDKLSSVELRRISTFEVDIKLDPSTAHSWLVVSPDGKAVSDGGEAKGVPDAPERFDLFGSILGLNGFTSGKSYWEVEVGNKTGWDLGVTRAGANRKGKLVLSPENGYWVMVHYQAKGYAALSRPAHSLSLTRKAQRVGVFVDYEEGLVSFYDVTARSHIYSFTQAVFGGEVVPYFSPHLKQNQNNSAPLLISAVRK